MRVAWNPEIECKQCGQKAMRRSEKLFLLSLKTLTISAIVAIPLLQSHTYLPWLPVWIQGVVVLTFILSICVAGYYAYYDRKQSFRCAKCLFEMTVPAPPLSWLQKILVGLFLATVVLVVVGLIVIVLTYKPEAVIR